MLGQENWGGRGFAIPMEGSAEPGGVVQRCISRCKRKSSPDGQFQIGSVVDCQTKSLRKLRNVVPHQARAFLVNQGRQALKFQARPRELVGRHFGPSNPEAEALQTAIDNKAPDAELKSRLERLREVRKENQAKLEKAQEELRAVLSLQQEAVAVVSGLLP